jgi:threonine-phosphate decarboxylase
MEVRKMLEQYGHGGDIQTAEEIYGRPEGGFLDYSSNMNPWGPPSVVETLIKDHWRDVVRYPDPEVRLLRQKISEIYQVPPESILVGNGAAELIDLTVRVLQPKATGITRPCFSEYGEAVDKVQGHLYEIPLHAEYDFGLQMEDVERGLNQADLLFLGHPNNPNGRLIPPEVLQFLLSQQQRLIVDEAFMDFIPQEAGFSLIRQAATDEHLFVIRSMTKFFAIPGIRLGFVVAHPRWIKQMKQLQVQWSVNYLAQLIGTAVLNEHEYITATKFWLQEERPWFTERLQALGLKVFPSDTNFLLISFPDHITGGIKLMQSLMGKRGILIRDASRFAGLGASYGRLAIRLRKDNERLLTELELAMKQEGGICL